MGAYWEVATERGGGAGRLRNFLLRSCSSSAVVWGGDMGDISDNGVEVRGSACDFPTTGNKVKGRAAEGLVVEEGSGENSTSGSGDTASLDLI